MTYHFDEKKKAQLIVGGAVIDKFRESLMKSSSTEELSIRVERGIHEKKFMKILNATFSKSVFVIVI